MGDVVNHKQVRQSLGSPAEEGQEPVGYRVPEEHSPQNQLSSSANKGSQRLKGQSQSLHGSSPGPMHTCYYAGCGSL